MNRTAPILLLSMLVVGSAQAQPARELRGSVVLLDEKGQKGKPAEGITVVIKESQGSDDTNTNGFFSIPIPELFRGGDNVRLSIEKAGYQIYRPVGGGQRIPADLARDQIEIQLLPVGSPLFLSAENIEGFLQEVAEKAREEVSRAGETKVNVDLSGSLRDWATRYGRGVAEVRSEVDAWIADVEQNKTSDYYRLGLAAFAKNQFGAAAAHFNQSAKENEEVLARAREEVDTLQFNVIRDYRNEGSAHYADYNFEAALEAYKNAHSHTDTTSYTWYWAATITEIGMAQYEQGIRIGGEVATGFLKSGIASYRLALEVRTREALPQDWARTQNNLGLTLNDLGLRSEGEAGLRLLREAETAYRLALEVSTREALPQQWATTQNNLGNTLNQIGLRSEGEAFCVIAQSCGSASRLALEVRTREALPQDWAMTQNNLGLTLNDLGLRSEGEAGLRLLREAETAYRLALELSTREALPQQWALTQMNLANTLNALGQRSEGEAGLRLLQEAETAFRLALGVYTREALPQQWALTQMNLANTLNALGQRSEGEAGLRLLREAETACRLALEVYTREALPQDWAMTQNNLGGLLAQQIVYFGEGLGSRGIAEAIEEALTISRELGRLSGYFSYWLALALNNVAWDWALKGEQLEQSLLYSEQSLVLTPDDASFLDTLAEIHLRLNHFDEAKEVNERARHHAGEDANALESINERTARIEAAASKKQ